MSHHYSIGTEIRIIATFTNNVTGQPADPTNVFFVIAYTPNNSSQRVISGTWQYGVNVEVVRDATGTYHMDYLPASNQAQFYDYKVYSTGDIYAASEDKEFSVR